MADTDPEQSHLQIIFFNSSRCGFTFLPPAQKGKKKAAD